MVLYFVYLDYYPNEKDVSDDLFIFSKVTKLSKFTVTTIKQFLAAINIHINKDG